MLERAYRSSSFWLLHFCAQYIDYSFCHYMYPSYNVLLVWKSDKVLYRYYYALYYMDESATPAGYNYTCNECGASFEAMEDLTKHYRQDHPK